MSFAPLYMGGTSTIGSGGTDAIPAVNTYTNGARLLVRANGAGVYVTDASSGTLPIGGFELLADREYVFDLPGAPVGSGMSADYEMTVKNSSGSTVTVSWLVTPLPR